VHGIGSIVQEKGLAGIYKGLVPTILKQGSNQGIRFLVYEDTKKQLFRHFSFFPEPIIFLLSGGVAGAASVFGSCVAISESKHTCRRRENPDAGLES
jgi:solute carrier family 25 citrate transporter 1